MGYIAKVVHKLHQDGIVQTVIFLELCTLFDSNLLPQYGKTGITGQNPGEGKRNEHNSKKNRKEEKDTPDQIECHKRI